MRPKPWFLLGVCIGLGALPAAGSPASVNADAVADRAALTAVQQHPYVDVCGPAPKGHARCYAKRRVDVVPAAGAQGISPSDLASAYGIPAGGGAGATIALIDAFDDPYAEMDLATYRQAYGLPACTTANGCFKKVNQNGFLMPLPSPNAMWGGEIALDIEMASATCPACKILLVEVDSDVGTNLYSGVVTAADLGAAAISNSWGSAEDSTIVAADDTYFKHPGVIITAATGDQGYGVQYPASSAYVFAVGGTTLTQSSSSRGWAEAAWFLGGSGCSGYIAKPSWQMDPGCSKRMEADLAALGDPNTGPAVYDTNSGGWTIVGGTSAATPIVAGILVATGKAGVSAGFVYQHASAFYDVTQGSNGACNPGYFCTAGQGYDGPTGVGTPNGTAIGAIVTCTSSAMCPPMTPVCDTSTNTCRACTAADCTGTKAICETSGPNAGECVECDPTHTSACTGGTPICDANGTCRACTAADCTGATGVCETSGPNAGMCVQCNPANTGACSGGTPVCDATGDMCRACAANADCPGQVCDTTADAQQGECVQCNTNADCGGAICDPTKHACGSGSPFGGPGGDAGSNPFGGGDGGNGATPGGGQGGSGCGCGIARREEATGWIAAALLGGAVLLRRRGRKQQA